MHILVEVEERLTILEIREAKVRAGHNQKQPPQHLAADPVVHVYAPAFDEGGKEGYPASEYRWTFRFAGSELPGSIYAQRRAEPVSSVRVF
jgi:hypothetical protein